MVVVGRGLFGVTCMLGRGRGKVPAHDLRSSSRARLSISNCLSCSRTEASREAVLAHCSIHTLRAEHRTGKDRTESTPESKMRFNQHQDLTRNRQNHPSTKHIKRRAGTVCLESANEVDIWRLKSSWS